MCTSTNIMHICMLALQYAGTPVVTDGCQRRMSFLIPPHKQSTQFVQSNAGSMTSFGTQFVQSNAGSSTPFGASRIQRQIKVIPQPIC